MIGTKVLEERKSKFNGNLRVVRTWGMGTYIQSNGLTQSGGIVEAIWRSTLAQIQDSRFKIRNVLVLGLGGGTVVKLIHKNWLGTRITGVDIDPIMIELSTRHLGLGTSGEEIIIQDAYHFLNQNDNSKFKKYDLVIVDLYNGDEYLKKFESENYIHLVRNILSSNGIAVFNRLYFGDKKLEAEEFGKKLEKVFGKVEKFRPEANLMFLCFK